MREKKIKMPAEVPEPTERPKERHWCFTINDKDGVLTEIDFREVIAKSWFRYMIIQQEMADTGMLHFQGYIECKEQIMMLTVKNVLPLSAHLEVKMGSREEARAYCMKEDTRIDGPWEFGMFDYGGQGSRNDILDLCVAIRDHGEREAVMMYPSMAIRYPRGVQYYASMLNINYNLRFMYVTLLYGPTGTGKSRYCYERAKYAYRKCGTGKFFDRYMGEKELIIDDFAGARSKVELTTLLQLLDIYPVTVETKGSTRSLLVEKFYITTNIHPRLWYDFYSRQGQYDALARRIHKVLWVKTDQDYVEVTHDSFFKDWAETCNEEQVFEVVEVPTTQDTESVMTIVDDETSEDLDPTQI